MYMLSFYTCMACDIASLKVVCHVLGNLISCLDDIIIMLRSNRPTSECAISRAGWPVYEVIYRCWDALGTVAAVLSLCETVVLIISLAAKMS